MTHTHTTHPLTQTIAAVHHTDEEAEHTLAPQFSNEHTFQWKDTCQSTIRSQFLFEEHDPPTHCPAAQREVIEEEEEENETEKETKEWKKEQEKEEDSKYNFQLGDVLSNSRKKTWGQSVVQHAADVYTAVAGGEESSKCKVHLVGGEVAAEKDTQEEAEADEVVAASDWGRDLEEEAAAAMDAALDADVGVGEEETQEETQEQAEASYEKTQENARMEREVTNRGKQDRGGKTGTSSATSRAGTSRATGRATQTRGGRCAQHNETTRVKEKSHAEEVRDRLDQDTAGRWREDWGLDREGGGEVTSSQVWPGERSRVARFCKTRLFWGFLQWDRRVVIWLEQQTLRLSHVFTMWQASLCTPLRLAGSGKDEVAVLEEEFVVLETEEEVSVWEEVVPTMVSVPLTSEALEPIAFPSDRHATLHLSDRPQDTLMSDHQQNAVMLDAPQVHCDSSLLRRTESAVAHTGFGIYIYILQIYTYIHIHVYICKYEYICVHVYIYVYMHIYMYICIYICTYIYTCISVCRHTNIYTCIKNTLTRSTRWRR